MRSDLISRQQAIKEMWKVLYEYEDKTEKQFQKSKDLDVRDWIMNDRLWVQNGHNLCVNVLANLPSAQPAADNDLVGRGAVKKWLERWDGYIDMDIIKRMQYRVIDIPSAQPERKNGHWVEIGDEPYDEWECDVCGFVIDGSGCIDPEEYRDVYRFCPRCGARMER